MIWTFWISANPGQESTLGLGHYSAGDTAIPDLTSAPSIMNQYIGQWVNVAATFPHPSGNLAADGNSHAHIYLNGGQVADGPWRFNHGYDPNIYLTIGQTTDSNGWADSPASFYGCLDEVRIYNRVLDANEIVYLVSTNSSSGALWIRYRHPLRCTQPNHKAAKRSASMTLSFWRIDGSLRRCSRVNQR
jgi:hypothetical protein